MTGGKSPIGYLKAYMTNLYLSKDSQKVTEAIEEGETPQKPALKYLEPPAVLASGRDVFTVCG